MKLIFKIIKAIVTVFLVIALIIVLFQKVTNNKIAIGNIFVFQIASGSMEPVYKVGDLIVSSKVDSKELKVGDDVTYLGKEDSFAGIIVTHRIKKIYEDEGKLHFITQGVANTLEDPTISEDDIYGKVVYHTVLFSFVGRLMTNIVVYYLIFIVVGVSFCYEIITTYFIKSNDEDEEKKE